MILDYSYSKTKKVLSISYIKDNGYKALMNFNVNKQLYLKYTFHAQYTTIILLNCDLLLIV